MKSIVLQERDKQILDLLRDQGFVSFEQLLNRHFKSANACSKRLLLLQNNDYIKSKTIKEYFQNNKTKGFFPHQLSLGLKGQSKIYFLSTSYRKLVCETNRLLKPDLCIHQLLLNEIRFFLESEIKDARFLLNDPQLKILSEHQLARRKEFTPDISIEHHGYTMAVELERTQKSANRYSSRFWYYRDSVYTHVIYYYVNEAHLRILLRYAGQARKFGFAHYLRPNQVLSKAWGYMTINEWISKVTSIQPKKSAVSTASLSQQTT